MFAPKVAKTQTQTGDGSPSKLALHSSTSLAPPLAIDSEVQVQSSSDRDPRSANFTPPRDVPSSVNDSGHPLDATALNNFQTSFGHDFSNVRVHTDERAAASAASVSARAFTIGRHIVFGRGEYAPGTSSGRHLLGHELAHVVQQSRGGPFASGAQSTSLDEAADHAANQALRGASVMVAGSSAVGIARKTIFEEISGGKYLWSLLRDVIEGSRPVATIVADVNGLTAAEREQAITDLVKERVERGCKQAFVTGGQSTLADPKDRAFLDPMLATGKSILDRYDAVIDGLAPTGTVRTKIPGWNFTPEDYAKLKGAKKDLTMAPDSSWFPAKLQDNLLKTLAFVLGPTVPVPAASDVTSPANLFCKATRIEPTATEGVNALDFFHGHLVVKKDKATDKDAKASEKAGLKFEKDLGKARKKAVGSTSFSTGYRMDEKKIAAYKEALEKIQPSLASLMETAMAIPGAAVMYHTFEFISAHDLKVKGQKMEPSNPRRHYVTPVDTNTPAQYTPPAKKTYEAEYTHIIRFSFLVDTQGAVHVRPLDTATNFTTLELSTITGTTYPEPLEFEK